jgi:hypothetical protein
MNNDVNPIWYTRAALYVGAFAMLLLFGFLAISLLRLERQEQVQAEATAVPFVACNFTNTGADSIPLYEAPYTAPNLAVSDVAPSVPYLVDHINAITGMVYIEIREGFGGYVDPFLGLATGDCDEMFIPRQDRPPTDYATVCRVQAAPDATLYDSVEAAIVLTTFPAGEPLVAIQRAEGGYIAGTLNGIEGFIRADEGTLDGACGQLP